MYAIIHENGKFFCKESMSFEKLNDRLDVLIFSNIKDAQDFAANQIVDKHDFYVFELTVKD